MGRVQFNGSNNAIETIADRLREIAIHELGDIKPRNKFLREIVTALNGEVVVEHNPTEFEKDGGSLVIYKDNRFTIKLPSSTSPLRDNFTIAHELGHYVLHFDKTIDRSEDLIFHRYGTGKDEWQANRFAAAFLMPRQEFLKLRKELHDNTWAISGYLEVSQVAVLNRMQYIHD